METYLWRAPLEVSGPPLSSRLLGESLRATQQSLHLSQQHAPSFLLGGQEAANKNEPQPADRTTPRSAEFIVPGLHHQQPLRRELSNAAVEAMSVALLEAASASSGGVGSSGSVLSLSSHPGLARAQAELKARAIDIIDQRASELASAFPARWTPGSRVHTVVHAVGGAAGTTSTASRRASATTTSVPSLRPRRGSCMVPLRPHSRLMASSASFSDLASLAAGGGNGGGEGESRQLRKHLSQNDLRGLGENSNEGVGCDESSIGTDSDTHPALAC